MPDSSLSTYWCMYAQHLLDTPAHGRSLPWSYLPAPTALLPQPPLGLWSILGLKGSPPKLLVIPIKTSMTETFWLIALPWISPSSGPWIYLTDAQSLGTEVSNILVDKSSSSSREARLWAFRGWRFQHNRRLWSQRVSTSRMYLSNKYTLTALSSPPLCKAMSMADTLSATLELTLHGEGRRWAK